MKRSRFLKLFAVATCSVFLSFGISAGDSVITIDTDKIVDLSQPMYEGMPFWPGGVPFKMDRLVDYDSGYQLHKFTIGENTGTHVDAPSHFIRGNKTISDLTPKDLVLPIIVIDAKKQSAKNPDYELSTRDIKNWEKANGIIPPNSLVIMNTGWHKKFSDPKAYVNEMHFPGFSVEAAELLLKRNIAAIGIDTLSLDNGQSKTFAAHLAMLKNNKFQIENMANLDRLPAKGATAFIGVLPVRSGSQAQARILAFLP